MNIGLAIHFGGYFDSLKGISQELLRLLGTGHQVHRLLPPVAYQSPEDEQTHAEEIVRASDVLVGFHSILTPLLAARSRLSLPRPCALFPLGAFSRGAGAIRQLLPHLTIDDVFVANCSADVALIRTFLPEARVELIPFAVDPTVFCPLAPEERAECRARFRLPAAAPVILYAGRMTLEKNLHTVLRVFAATHRHLHDAILVLAGPIQDVPFSEAGVAPVSLARWIDKIVLNLRMPPKHIRYLGPLGPRQLRELYNTADVAMNLTLHHDENFGLAQVEAIACGTPVIGTAWGGLRDTIRDGINGYQVGVLVTPLGVKLNWWSAINKTVRLLTIDAKATRFERPAIASTAAEYLPMLFQRRVLGLLESLGRGSVSRPTPLAMSHFAYEFWDFCIPGPTNEARYPAGTRAFQLYRDLIGMYAAATPDTLTAATPLEDDQVLLLAAPTAIVGRSTITVHDPMYPLSCRVAAEKQASVSAVIRAMMVEPAMTVARVRDDVLRGQARSLDAIRWMLSLGLLLRSPNINHAMLPLAAIGADTIALSFVTQRVDRSATDFLAFEG